MSETKRKDIKERIEAGESRNAERTATLSDRAAQARDQATEFARDHPIALIAGGLVLGIAISALFPRSPTRRIGREVGSKAAGIAAMAAELAALYGERALGAAQHAGRTGLDRFEDLSDSANQAARSLRRAASYLAGNASDSARAMRRGASKRVSRAIRDHVG